MFGFPFTSFGQCQLFPPFRKTTTTKICQLLLTLMHFPPGHQDSELEVLALPIFEDTCPSTFLEKPYSVSDLVRRLLPSNSWNLN